MRMTISQKLIFVCLSIAIPEALILGAIAYHSIQELLQANRQLEEISRSLEVTKLLEKAVNQALIPLNIYLVSGDSKQRQRFQDLKEIIRKNLALCHNAQCHSAPKQPSEMVKAIQPAIDEIEEKSITIFSLSVPFQDDLTGPLMKRIEELARGTDILLGKMSSALQTRIEVLRQKSQNIHQRAINTVLIWMVVLVMVAILVSYYTSQRLTRPLSQLLLATQKVRKGNLDQLIDVKTKDEIGELADSFNRMVKALKTHRGNEERTRGLLELEVKEMNDGIRQAEAFLIQSDKLASIGLLTSGVAHELNNPLTSILMNVNLLMEIIDKDTELYKELQMIDEDCSRCKKIVDDLLSFSYQNKEPTDGTKKSCFDIVASLGKVISLVQSEIIRRNIEIELDLAAELPPSYGDEKYIQQVFINIILNAIQSIEKKGKIRILTSFSRPGNCIEIIISDNGPGIPPEHRHKIFDPFFTTKPEGTGLGLSISQVILSRYGGSIEIESLIHEEITSEMENKTKGTIVKLTLPMVNSQLSFAEKGSQHGI